MKRFPTLAEVERQHIKRALELARGNLTEAARMLGVHRSTLYRRQLEAPQKDAEGLTLFRGTSSVGFRFKAIAPLLLLLTACGISEAEPEPQELTPRPSCVIDAGEHFVPLEGECYQVTAGEGSLLAACAGEHESHPFDRERVNGTTQRFKLGPGECYRFYWCGDQTTAATVTPCL